MMTFLLIIALLIAIVIVGVLVYAATMPKQFRITRSATINAPADVVFPLIDDLKTMNRWNPFATQDPKMVITYTGPASGKGAGFHWDSTGRGGKGSMETLDSVAPSHVEMRLDMLKPMEGHNTVVFTLQSIGSATEVNWTMFGPWPYVHRIFGVVFNTDKMIGGAFNKGLADLKALAEQSSTPKT